MLSLRHDFPDVWHKLQIAVEAHPTTIALSTNLLPYMLRYGFKPQLSGVFFAPLPNGKLAEPPVKVGTSEIIPNGWSVTLPLFEKVAEFDDVTLLARFKFVE